MDLIAIKLGLEAIEYWIIRKQNLILQRFTKEFILESIEFENLFHNVLLISQRFTKEFILESIEFILKNDNFLFDSKLVNQIFGTAMGTKCAPPYPCLTIGYEEETKLFT